MCENGDLNSKMAVAAGIEPTTCSLGESRSIQLSYATASHAGNDLQTALYRRFPGQSNLEK